MCKNSKPIGRNKGCKTRGDCLETAKKKCDEDSRCHGIAWFWRDTMHICYSRETESKRGWGTILKKDGIYVSCSITYLYTHMR